MRVCQLRHTLKTNFTFGNVMLAYVGNPKEKLSDDTFLAVDDVETGGEGTNGIGIGPIEDEDTGDVVDREACFAGD